MIKLRELSLEVVDLVSSIRVELLALNNLIVLFWSNQNDSLEVMRYPGGDVADVRDIMLVADGLLKSFLIIENKLFVIIDLEKLNSFFTFLFGHNHAIVIKTGISHVIILVKKVIASNLLGRLAISLLVDL